MSALLQQLYYNPKIGFESEDKLYHKAHDINNTVTHEDVEDFLNLQEAPQITKPLNREVQFDTVESPSVKNNYQMDIMYLPNPTFNNNHKYLLTCIDVYSRYCFVKALRNREGDNVFTAFKEMVDENGKPKNLNVDLGSEFVYKPFVNYCKENHIKLWYSNPDQANKNSIIERFHRTLRNIILKYTVVNGRKYIDELDDFMYNYNHTYDRDIKNSPIDIWKGKEKNDQSYNIVPHLLEVGDQVRHTLEKEIYGKNSSTPTYTRKIFTITKKEGNAYYLDDIEKPFREHELIPAIGENNNEREDEEVKMEDKAKHERKQNKILKDESINQDNIIETKRERKPNLKYLNYS